MNLRATLLLTAAGMLAATATPAQTVWRCGADGRVFSDRPCSDGRLLPAQDLADARSDEQVRQAHAVAARERRLADALRQERLAREAVALAAPADRRAERRRAVLAAREAATEATNDKGARSAAAAGAVRPTALQPAPASRRAQAPRLRPAGDGTSPAAARASRRSRD